MIGEQKQVSRRLVIAGDVQGVSFRDWAADQARALGLAGYVRNLEDGTVEIVMSGPEIAMSHFAALCEDGPPAADVKDVQSSDTDEEVGPGFERKPSA